MNWYDAACEYSKRTWSHDGRLSALPDEWQRELVALMLVIREVNNGAYLQFFVNHGREVYEYASRSLGTLGAHRTREIVDTCQLLIDEHAPKEAQSEDRTALLTNECIGPDGETVKEPGSVLPDWVLDRVLELSDEFMAYPEDVGDLAQAHFGPLIENDVRTESEGAP